MISKDEFCLIAELWIRLSTIIFLIIAICLMPSLTGIPAVTFIIPLNGITLGLTAMWSTETLLLNEYIPIDTLFLYGIVPTIALVYLTHDLLKFLKECS